MSHPDPCYDPDNSYEDDDMVYHDDTADALYDDYNDFNEMVEDGADDFWYDESMDGDHDSAMRDAGFGTDEDYGHYGDDIDAFHDYYGEDY
jgi:hypothetical protein